MNFRLNDVPSQPTSEQYAPGAEDYEVVTVPPAGVEVFDMDSRTMISRANSSMMLRVLVMRAFCHGTYKIFDLANPQQVNNTSLKAVAHTCGLGRSRSDLEDMFLEVNRMNIQEIKLQNGLRGVGVDMTVYFAAKKKSYAQDLYLVLDTSWVAESTNTEGAVQDIVKVGLTPATFPTIWSFIANNTTKFCVGK
ncbi:hypothetical protein SCHPADRAFT_896786 [Schizopora paradoxa]|uniref:Uncharacterized protein n=1 Tax=Schizopora paradoxa TaxID=27342 RepID=A0A0H2R5J9_9AGAM|nr:hypothetical protein SCHPADRAFT_896786 [Schizopora paradoxa]